MTGGHPHRYAVAYDLSDDRERRRADKVLRGWGHRVQKSVFTVTTTRHGLARLQGELEREAFASGNILIFRLQADLPLLAVGTGFADPDAAAAYVA